MIPTPKAMAKAQNTASIPLESPDKESPDMVSLMAFVIATPGTRYIIEPIIIISRFSPSPNSKVITENKEAKNAPKKLSIKKS